MRYLVLIITILVSFSSSAQTTVSTTGQDSTIIVQKGGIGANQVMTIPQDTNINKYSNLRKNGRIAVKNGVFYAYDSVNGYWKTWGAGGASYTGGFGVNISGTVIYLDSTEAATLYALKDSSNQLRTYMISLLTNYYTKSQSDARYLQSYTETDPVWLAEKSSYLTSSVAATTYTPQSRTITINGTTQDLSANRTYTIPVLDTSIINVWADTLDRIATKYQERKPTTVGTIYNKSTWANLNDFTVNGATASVSGGNIYFSGGANTYTQTLDYEYYTAIPKNHITAKFVASEKTSTSYGFGIGLRSANSTYGVHTFCTFNMSNGSDAGKVKIVAHTGTVAATSTALSFSAGDTIILDFEVNDDNVIAAARNKSTGSGWVTTQYNFFSGLLAHYNTSKFSIFSIGGSFILDSINIRSNEIRNPELAIMGDSKSSWYVTTQPVKKYGFMWSGRLQKSIQNVSIYAGGGDKITDLINRVPEMWAVAPKKILLNIGWNDFRLGTNTDTILKNYDTLVARLQRYNTEVYHLLWFYDTTTNQSALVSHIQANYPANRIIDTYNPTYRLGNNAFYDSGVHPSDSANTVIIDAILSSGLLNNAYNANNRLLYKEDSTLYSTRHKLDSVAALAVAVPTLQQVTNVGATTTNTTTVGALVTDTIGNTGSASNLQLTSTDNATKGNIMFGASSMLQETNNTLFLGHTTMPTGISLLSTTRLSVMNSNTSNVPIFGAWGSSTAGTALSFYRGSGTMSSPSAVEAGDEYFRVQCLAHDGTTYQNVGAMYFKTFSALSGTNRGTQFLVETAAENSISRVERISTNALGDVVLNRGGGSSVAINRLLAGTETYTGDNREIYTPGQAYIGDSGIINGALKVNTTTNGIVKASATGVYEIATAGTDYLNSTYIEDAINNGTTNKAPSENAVYDALALKKDIATDTVVWAIAASDLTTALTTGTNKAYFRMPYAATLVKVKASVLTVSSSGTPTFDINEGGTSVLGTKLSIDASEKTSETAASAATITDSALARDAEITIDIDTAGTSTAGAIIYLYWIKA